MLFMMVVLVVGCGSNGQVGADKDNTPAKPAKQKDVSNPPEPQKDENGNYNLTVVGQKIKAYGGVVELKKIKEINENVDITPIKVTVKNIKVFNWKGADDQVRHDIASLSGVPAIPDDFNYIQVILETENTQDKNIDFPGLEKVVLNTGEQLDADANDFIIGNDDTDTVFNGKVKKEMVIGLYTKSKPEDIKSVKLIFYPTTDSSTYETIKGEQQVEYNL